MQSATESKKNASIDFMLFPVYWVPGLDFPNRTSLTSDLYLAFDRALPEVVCEFPSTPDP